MQGISSTSRRNARSADSSFVKTITWAPVIMILLLICRMPRVDLGPQSVGRNLPRGIAIEAERRSDRSAKKRIAKRQQHQPQGAVRHVMIFVGDGQLPYQGANRVEDRNENVSIARQDHPGSQRAGAALTERIERLIDDLAGVGLVLARALDTHGHCSCNFLRDRASKF